MRAEQTKGMVVMTSNILDIPKNTIICGDCKDVLATIPDNTFTSVITDPPYGLAFMGKDWDKQLPDVGIWREILRVSKPGATLLAFGGTRTFHRLACMIEDAGWIIQDCLMWIHAMGFPKGGNIAKAVDRELGAEPIVVGYSNQGAKSIFDGGKPRPATLPATLPATMFEGYYTALKPAWEPIILAVKKIEGNYGKNALEHGVAGMNIGASRIGASRRGKARNTSFASGGITPERTGRYPSNLLFSHHDDCTDIECHEDCPVSLLNKQSGPSSSSSYRPPDKGGTGNSVTFCHKTEGHRGYSDNGYASRFFFCAKASPNERTTTNFHPTVKPLKLMAYLVRLLAPPRNAFILDPFCGSGTTLLACKGIGVNFLGIERDQQYAEMARQRLTETVMQTDLFDSVPMTENGLYDSDEITQTALFTDGEQPL